MKYCITYSEKAVDDLRVLYSVICYDYSAPITAKRYLNGLFSKIESLSSYPKIYAIYRRKSVRQYGSSVRRVNYRKMAVLYTLQDDTVYIHRIIPAGSISGLAV